MSARIKLSAIPSIVIVTPSTFLLGGIQTWLDYLVPGLERFGWNVTVLLADGDCSDAQLYLQHHPFRQTRFVTNQTGSREGRVRALVQSIRLATPDFVLGVNIVDVFSAVTRLRHSGNKKIKVAMALHGLQPCFFQDLANLKSVIDGVIAPNRLATTAAIKKSGIPPERAFYAPCGVLVPNLQELNLTHGKLILLYAGRLDAGEKRIMDLPLILAALEKHNVDFHFRIAGAGPSEDALRISLSKFGEKVQFMGVLGEAALRTNFFIPGSVLLIMPPSETGPLVAWDAMANGVALVTSRFVGIGLEGSLRDGANCLTYPVGDTEMAAHALAQLVNPARRLELIIAGYQMISHRYNREASIEHWNRALHQILALPVPQSSADFDSVPVAGRLDRAFGVGPAEYLRCMLRISHKHLEPGGEWPHSQQQ